MVLKIQKTLTREYHVKLFCPELNQTKDATLEDLIEMVGEHFNNNLKDQVNDLLKDREYLCNELKNQINDLIKEKAELVKQLALLSEENLKLKELILFQMKPGDPTCCREQYDPYDDPYDNHESYKNQTELLNLHHKR